MIKEKIEKWDRNNSKPTPAEIRAEIRRLKNLLASHETLLLVGPPPLSSLQK